jgi:hypothetical protein
MLVSQLKPFEGFVEPPPESHGFRYLEVRRISFDAVDELLEDGIRLVLTVRGD